jgi:hypothetical protein
MVRLGLLVVGLGVVCVAAVGVVAYMRLPTLAQQVPPPGGGVLLTLVQPVNGSSLNVGETVPVSAESTGTADVQSADLWVDGQDVGPGTPSSGAQPFSTYWSWSPAGPGEHTLSVHAELNDGSAITSNLVRVSAVKPTGAVSAALPQGENPQPTPTPASGGNAGAGGSAGSGGQAGGAGQPPASPPSGPGFWVQSHLPGGAGGSKPPAAPKLAAQVNGCDVQLTLTDQSDNESGFVIYRSDPATVDYKQAYQWGPEKGSGISVIYPDKGLYGTVSYYAEAYNQAGSSDSSPVTVQVNNVNCLTVQWSGIALDQGKITTSTPVDKLYCYNSTSNSPWTRIPLTIGKFIPKDKGGFDVSHYMNKLITIGGTKTPLDLKFECWGWAGGQLKFLGSGEQTFDPSQTGNLHITGTNFDFAAGLKTMPLDGQPPAPEIVFPYDVQRTSDPVVCTQHAGVFGGLICKSALKDRYAAIVWKLTDLCGPGVTNCITQVDGYHVYELQKSGNPALIKTINGQKRTLALIPPPGWPGLKGTQHCIMVRAFVGKLESADSPVTCYTYDDLGTQTIMLKPNPVGFRWNTSLKCDFSHTVGFVYSSFNVPADAMAVGHVYNSAEHCDWRETNYRGAVWFDLSQIPGKIIEARLQYTYEDGFYRQAIDVATNEERSCATHLMVGTDDWRVYPAQNGPSTIPGKDYMPVPEGFPQSQYDFDVTPVVKAWRSGAQPNYGFVLRGYEKKPGSDSFSQASCATLYDNFVLAVTYYKP